MSESANKTKILYSLGCTCDPHMTWQQFSRELVAPSLFAGLIQLQDETEDFIPRFLFDGTLEKYFFNVDEWKKIEMVDCLGFSKESLFRDPSDSTMFQYHYNLQDRAFLDCSKINVSSLQVVKDSIYYNHKLHLLNIHADEKTLGVNPMQVDYQKKKYEYFLNNRFNLKFGIYLHRNATETQLEDFQNLIENQGFDCKNFIVFVRNSQKSFERIKFNKVWLKCNDDEQTNLYYTSQKIQMIAAIKEKFNL